MLILVESRARDDDETDTTGSSPDVDDFLKRLPRLRNHYKTLIEERNPQQWGLKHDSNCYFLTEVVSSIPGSWTQDNGFRLCHNLVAAAADWEKIAPAGMSCPFHFANEELSVHKRDLKVVADLAQVLDQLEQGGIIPNAGKVLPDDYERALDASRSVKEWFPLSMGVTLSNGRAIRCDRQPDMPVRRHDAAPACTHGKNTPPQPEDTEDWFTE
ncbi:hypothetical protein EG328_010731 [Venturia inaequalis]|uniref:Uncharacterized protein n=1 Tax=Venturia inaequalis TaxID=5025 RepID=A0A8H3YKN7_VENIN|nr:hypothetical protein EG328_010731 [Venturia inaequalis]